MSNTITNLTRTRWKLNASLTGENRPDCITWTNSYYNVIGDLDGFQLNGFAFVKTPNLTPMSTLNPNLTDISLPSGALLCSLNTQSEMYPGITKFLDDCTLAGLTDFNLGAFANAFYISMHVTASGGGSALLAGTWASTITHRLLTIYSGTDVTNPDLIAWLEANATYEGHVEANYPSLGFKPLAIGEPYKTGGSKISYSTGYNKIKVSFQSNMSLNYAEARITREGIEPDVGIGELGDQISGSIAANTYTDLIIPVTATTFTYGSGNYVLGIYARSAADNTWSEVYFFLTVDNEQVVTADDYNLEVVKRDIETPKYNPPIISGTNIALDGVYSASVSDNTLNIE